MTHWLEAIRRVVDQPDWRPAGRRALILGDPLHRAAELCRAAGLKVVRVATPHGVAGRLIDREPGDTVVWSEAEALPFVGASFDLIVLHETLEFCHDDRLVLGNLSGLLVDDGFLVARLPRRGRVAALDALNLYRYASELIGRADIPSESEPIGWRRHYDESDLEAIFPPASLAITRIASSGWGAGEAAYLPALLATRSISDRPATARRARDWYARFGDLDEHLAGPATFVVTATRHHDDPTARPLLKPR